jgi:hypothetical protein
LGYRVNEDDGRLRHSPQETILHHFSFLPCEEQANIENDEDIAGQTRGGLSGGDGVVASK